MTHTKDIKEDTYYMVYRPKPLKWGIQYDKHYIMGYLEKLHDGTRDGEGIKMIYFHILRCDFNVEKEVHMLNYGTFMDEWCWYELDEDEVLNMVMDAV